MIQVALHSGPRHLVTWVDEDKTISVGDRITLKNHPEKRTFWTVDEIYGQNTSTIHRDWKVGGL